jgi:hypothetical protein
VCFLLGLCIIGNAVLRFLRQLKYGSSSLQFERFPFFLGGLLTASLVPNRGIYGCRHVTFTIRCIQERMTVGEGSTQVREQIWADTFDVNQPTDMRAGQAIPVTFQLPDDRKLSTALADRPKRYWELEVAAATPGIKYNANFLVPVYARR